MKSRNVLGEERREAVRLLRRIQKAYNENNKDSLESLMKFVDIFLENRDV
ncbi:hypothetical protein [Caulobacter phage Cr30]|nr:hypothetical protein OZ74_gp231 [Caulobacter phage Cr30]AGS81112.1 hypothetical protein [Caulobacter phage Cr30]